mmetsp:Transcript_18058/g.51366  ORF Transcript_18058/g.51366 Transcript_18058/m.51366 type:complete len:215 (-) Transcript_18058:526-1170(-)
MSSLFQSSSQASSSAPASLRASGAARAQVSRPLWTKATGLPSPAKAFAPSNLPSAVPAPWSLAPWSLGRSRLASAAPALWSLSSSEALHDPLAVACPSPRCALLPRAAAALSSPSAEDSPDPADVQHPPCQAQFRRCAVVLRCSSACPPSSCVSSPDMQLPSCPFSTGPSCPFSKTSDNVSAGYCASSFRCRPAARWALAAASRSIYLRCHLPL